jgi:hypothetical protein
MNTISYNNLINNIKNTKIIGIGENLHGANFSFKLREKIIKSLLKYNKKIIICLEEDDKLLKEGIISNLFPMHQSNAFIKFYKFCLDNSIQIIGIDDYNEKSRNTAMYNNIISLAKKFSDYQIIFLAFDSHISTYYNKTSLWKPNYKTYDEREEVGYKLKNKYGNNYISIGLIVKKGKTIGKIDSNHSKLVILDFENNKNILKLNNNIYISNKSNDMKYSGVGPYYANGFNTKFLDYFWIYEKTSNHLLVKKLNNLKNIF